MVDAELGKRKREEEVTGERETKRAKSDDESLKESKGE